MVHFAMLHTTKYCSRIQAKTHSDHNVRQYVNIINIKYIRSWIKQELSYRKQIAGQLHKH